MRTATLQSGFKQLAHVDQSTINNLIERQAQGCLVIDTLSRVLLEISYAGDQEENLAYIIPHVDHFAVVQGMSLISDIMYKNSISLASLIGAEDPEDRMAK